MIGTAHDERRAPQYAHIERERRWRVEGVLAPLEIAEIEWPDDAGLQALHAPSWAVREISNDPRYQGGTLATDGLPKD